MIIELFQNKCFFNTSWYKSRTDKCISSNYFIFRKPKVALVALPTTSICRTGARKGICQDHIIVKTAPLSNKISSQIPTHRTITLTRWRKCHGRNCLAWDIFPTPGGKRLPLAYGKISTRWTDVLFMWGMVCRNAGKAQGNFSPSMSTSVTEEMTPYLRQLTNSRVAGPQPVCLPLWWTLSGGR